MRKALRIAGQIFIGVFFVLHVTAIGLYAIPMNTQDTTAKFLRDTVLQPFIPYILSTSQWQQWNLFSPDPLRRVTRYYIQQKTEDDRWATLASFTPETYSLWRHANHFKLFIDMLEVDQDTYRAPIAAHFPPSRPRGTSYCSLSRTNWSRVSLSVTRLLFSQVVGRLKCTGIVDDSAKSNECAPTINHFASAISKG